MPRLGNSCFMRLSNSAPWYLRKLDLLQRHLALKDSWFCCHTVVSGTLLNRTYSSERCLLSVWVTCTAPSPPRCSAMLQTATLYGLSSPGYGLIVRLLTRFMLYKEEDHTSEMHQNKSRAKLELAAFCSITSLHVSFSSRSLHKVMAAMPNWKRRFVLMTPGAHLQNCQQAFTRSSP